MCRTGAPACRFSTGGPARRPFGGCHTLTAEGGCHTLTAEGGCHTPTAEGGCHTPTAEGGCHTPTAEGGCHTLTAEGGCHTLTAEGGCPTFWSACGHAAAILRRSHVHDPKARCLLSPLEGGSPAAGGTGGVYPSPIAPILEAGTFQLYVREYTPRPFGPPPSRGDKECPPTQEICGAGNMQ